MLKRLAKIWIIFELSLCFLPGQLRRESLAIKSVIGSTLGHNIKHCYRLPLKNEWVTLNELEWGQNICDYEVRMQNWIIFCNINRSLQLMGNGIGVAYFKYVF